MVDLTAFAAGRVAARDLDAGIAHFQRHLATEWARQGMKRSKARAAAAQFGQIMRQAVAKIPSRDELQQLTGEVGLAEALRRYSASVAELQRTVAMMPQLIFLPPATTGAN